MKKLFGIFLFVFFATYSFGQDVIILKNGTKVEAKILEISSSTVKYYRFSQPTGPTRILELHEISEITFEDGSSEKFDVKAPVVANNQTVERPIKPYQDPTFKRGFFVDRVYGLTNQTSTDYNYVFNEQYPEGMYFPVRINSNLFLAGLKIGNKWYFGKNEKWRLGFQTTWLRLSSFLGNENSGMCFSILNIGVCSVIKLNEKRAVETNVQVGPSVIMNNNEYSGFAISLEGKYRIKKFAVGLDYQFVKGYNYQNYNGVQFDNILNNISLTAGFKF